MTDLDYIRLLNANPTLTVAEAMRYARRPKVGVRSEVIAYLGRVKAQPTGTVTHRKTGRPLVSGKKD